MKEDLKKFVLDYAFDSSIEATDRKVMEAIDEFFEQKSQSSVKDTNFYQNMAKQYLDSLENWETSPSEKISINCFANWLERKLNPTEWGSSSTLSML